MSRRSRRRTRSCTASSLKLEDALQRIEAECPTEHTRHLVAFIRAASAASAGSGNLPASLLGSRLVLSGRANYEAKHRHECRRGKHECSLHAVVGRPPLLVIFRDSSKPPESRISDITASVAQANRGAGLWPARRLSSRRLSSLPEQPKPARSGLAGQRRPAAAPWVVSGF